MKILHETDHYAVVDCKHISSRGLNPNSAVPIQTQMVESWLEFFEDLHDRGLRPIQRFERPDAVVCEKFGLALSPPKTTKAATQKVA